MSHPAKRIGRRLVILVVLVAQAIALVAAYHNDHKPFGFHMFPEASRWKAEIVRVEADGTRVPVDQDWEYRWSDLVRGRGLTNPTVWHHADSGLRNQLAFFDEALEWVADHTPADTSTRYLEAEVTYLDNGRGPFVTVVRTEDRDLG